MDTHNAGGVSCALSAFKIRCLIALLLSGYVLSIPIDPETDSELTTVAPIENLDGSSTENAPAPKEESDLKTEPSVWFSYHSFHSAPPPPPLILPGPRVYTSYYANYAPVVSYWSTF